MTPQEELHALVVEFQAWTNAQGLFEEGDALDLLHSDITSEQRFWLEAFISRWDVTQARSDTHDKLSPFGFERKCMGGECFGWSKINSAGEEIVICTDDSQTENPRGMAAEWVFSVFSEGDEVMSGGPTWLSDIVAELQAAGRI